MADYIISPYSLSFNSIKTALQNYIATKSDVTTTWTDFYTSGAGQTVLELDAAVASFYAFHFIIGRREAYITTAQNYSSLVGGAESLGYCTSRGHNVHIELEITANCTMVLPKWYVVGTYADYDVVMIEEAIINSGETATIKCVIGNSNVQSITISNDEIQQFVFTAEDSTDDCRLILNSTELPIATELKYATDDNYIILTNAYGAIDVFYLNNGDYCYKANDTLYFHYIEANTLTYGSLSTSSLSIDVATTVDSISCIEDYQEKEDSEHIRLAAPLYHETNNVVRARRDYTKYLIINNKFIVDANDKDISPGYIAITYLKKQSSDTTTSLLTDDEIEEYQESIMSACPDGVAEAIIVDPVRVVRNLDIQIWKNSGEIISTSIEDDIEEIISEYENKLAPDLDLEQIEHDIEDLYGVKIARVDIGTTEYTLNTKYKLYDVVTVDNILVGTEYETWTMYVSAINTESGDSEPDWSSASNTGDTVDDNNVVWKNTNKYTGSSVKSWSSRNAYTVYDDINVGYTVEASCTTSTEPSWGATLISDGNVTWNLLKSYDYVLEDYQTNTQFALEEYVIIGDDKDDRAIYQVTELLHKTGSEEPDWSEAAEVGDEIEDNAVTWTMQYLTWAANTTYYTGAEVGVVIDDVLYTYVCAYDHTSGTGNPLTGDETISIDNVDCWTLIESFDNYVEWVADTEFDLDSYILNDYGVFQITSIENSATGDNTTFQTDGEWITTITDNNIVWTLDTYTISNVDYYCTGGAWHASTAYTKGDQIIASTDDETYLYLASYVNDTAVTSDSVIYSVVNYCGTTSDTEPTWGDENVIDNDILWTKTDNESQIEWEANTTKYFGDIITTDEGYYVFSSVLGTSGDKEPNWAGITNNEVEDNNIIWSRITDNTVFSLQWNEYLDLTYTYEIVS